MLLRLIILLTITACGSLDQRAPAYSYDPQYLGTFDPGDSRPKRD